jgi:hypothetical protein
MQNKYMSTIEKINKNKNFKEVCIIGVDSLRGRAYPLYGRVHMNMLLIIFGDDVIANALLARTKGNILDGTTAGWIVITTR